LSKSGNQAKNNANHQYHRFLSTKLIKTINQLIINVQ